MTSNKNDLKKNIINKMKTKKIIIFRKNNYIMKSHNLIKKTNY